MTATRMSVATERNRRSLSIDRRRIRERDAVRRDWEVRLLEGESLDDIQRPEFLGHAGDRVNPGDRVCILAHDLSFWLELLVIDRDVNLHSVRTVILLGPVDLAPRIAAGAQFDLSKAQIEQVGDSWRLRLGSRVLSAGFKTKADAAAHLGEIKNGRKASPPPA